MPKIVALILFLAGGVGLFFSMREVVWEARIVKDFVATPADVTFSETPGLAQGKSSTYFPTVHYHYAVGGRDYESSKIWPYVGTIYRTEALKVMHNFPAGAQVKAFVDPKNPATSVLIRDYSSFPYWPAAGSVACLALGSGSLVRFLRPKRKKMQAIVANDFGWQFLLPAKRFTERLHEAIFLLLAIGTPIAVLAWHLSVRAAEWTPYVLMFDVMSAVIFVALLMWLTRVWRVTSRISDLRLTVNSAPMRLGKNFVLRVEADIHSRIQFSEMRARVVCLKRNIVHFGRRTHFQTIILGQRVLKLIGKSALPKGDVLKGTSETVFSADEWPPSGPESSTRYPYIDWELRIEVVGPIAFIVTFPLEVVHGDMARSSATAARQKV